MKINVNKITTTTNPRIMVLQDAMRAKSDENGTIFYLNLPEE